VRALILQFETSDPPDHLGRRFTARGMAWDVALMSAPHDVLSLDRYDMLVGLGGTMSVNEGDAYPYLGEAMGLIRAAVDRDIPYLGICLGGQLLAGALGAVVTRNPAKEVGLVPVTLAPGAGDDPLLRGLDPVLETAQFHEDTFAIPPGGVCLASSALCAAQIARCAPRAYALQFHPEVSWRTFADWIARGYAAFVGPDKAGDGPALADAVRVRDAAIRAHADALFDNFVDLAARVCEKSPSFAPSATPFAPSAHG